jgi:hypothetical protein
MSASDQREQLRSYLAAQSAKLSAADIRRRLDDAAAEFFAAVGRATDATARTRPAAGEWSVAEIAEHVARTLEDVTRIMRALTGGRRPARSMSSHQPAGAGAPLADLVARIRAGQAAVAGLLDAQRGEPHTDLRIAESDFGEINWKGYALILRLHYRDHAQQVEKTLDAIAGRAAG